MLFLRNLVIVYYTVINVVALYLYGSDKKRAIDEKYRIPEKVLLGVAAIGGALGAFVGMYLFRHKINKNYFKLLVPIALIAHIFLLSYLMKILV